MNLRAITRRRPLVVAITGIAVFGVAVVALSVRGKTAEPRAARSPALEFLPTDVLRVQAQPLDITLALTGTLTPLVEATLKARVAGELTQVTVREGRSVKKGEVLARIDPTEVRARVAARAADLEAARAQEDLAAKNRDTQKALLAKGFISQNAFDSTQSGYEVALARRRAAQAELEVARKALGDAVLAAPFAGIVAQRHAEPGERVAVDARIVTLVDLTRLELEAALPPAAIARVRVGQPLSFRVDGFGEREFTGRIERINPAVSAGTRSISVYALIDNPGATLRGGMFAQGALSLGRVENALAVPLAAVREEGGQPFVYALVDDTVRKKRLKLGTPGPAGSVQVLEGLAAGDLIVQSNLGALREGAPATVRDIASTQPARDDSATR